MAEKKAAALVITALDEIAYTLNLRGSDIDYNPVFFSYLLITPTTVTLFTGDGELPCDVVAHLEGEGVESFDGVAYCDVVSRLEKLAVSVMLPFYCSTLLLIYFTTNLLFY
ncbi:hypothetical protein O3G_MSEX000679 [Manduca sexta]|nr:hypothetical protein O3G_MSEX000679 [Manduca sexta]